jgi:hypothetical protein
MPGGYSWGLRLRMAFSVVTSCAVPIGKKVNTREECHLVSSMQELQASRRGNQWYLCVKPPVESPSIVPRWIALLKVMAWPGCIMDLQCVQHNSR